MNSQKAFQFLFLTGTVLFMLGVLLFFKQGELPLLGAKHHSNLICQNVNTYLGPTEKIPGNQKLIKIQVLVYNDPDPKGVKITSVQFNGTSIPLKPRDIYGFRGQASFQKPPGKYKLTWEVERDPQIWPRTVDHEENVFLDDQDLWIQISIIGEKAEIS